MLSLNDQSVRLEGAAFFFSAFQVVSSLEPVYLQSLTRAAQMHSMLERTNIDGSKVIVEVISLQANSYGMVPKAFDADSSDEEDAAAVNQNVQSGQPPTTEKNGKAKSDASKPEEEKKKAATGANGKADPSAKPGDPA